MSDEEADNVFELDDHRPHVTIHDSVRKVVHVVPLAALEDFASGKLEAFEDPNLLRAIVADWLNRI